MRSNPGYLSKHSLLYFTPQANFPVHDLNFHWRWRWWDQIQATFQNLFYFTMCYTFKMCRNKQFYIAAKPVRNKLCMHVYCMETTINTKDKDGTWLQKHCKAWLETITLVFIFFLPIFCTISIIYKLLNSLPFNFGRELSRCLCTSSVMSNLLSAIIQTWWRLLTDWIFQDSKK